MAANDLGDSRPPPSRQNNLTIFTPGIPWYRDIKILRLIAQAVFAIFVIGAVILLRNNLTSNLQESNISFDLEIYGAPFTVAIAEGISLTSRWDWTENLWFSWRSVRVLLGLSIAGIVFVVLSDHQRERKPLLAAATAALFGLCAAYTPYDIVWTLTIFNQDVTDLPSQLPFWVPWLAVLAGAGYLAYLQLGTGERLQKVIALAGAAVPYMIAVEFRPGRIEDWLDTTGLVSFLIDSPILPDVIIPILAIAIWLIPLLTAAALAFYIYVHEMASNSTILSLAALLFLVVTLVPTGEAATEFWIFTQTYLAPSTTARAFITGLYNTLRVVAAALVACTILGILVGIGLLSNNFLVRNISKVYVEIFRNTPLLIQLLFVYRTLTLLLPSPRESLRSPGSVGPVEFENTFYFLNARGLWYPAVSGTGDFPIFAVTLILGFVAFYFVRRWRLSIQDRTGKPAYALRYSFSVLLLFTVVGWLLAGGPFSVDYPVLEEGARNVEEGARLSMGFVALFLGLTLYTAAFIADIVRAGIQSVPFGQIEAARSQGLTGSQVLSLVVLPQALRLIIPPLGNQYVNLGKNSSLGIVVTYFDTYRIAQLANNETGQAVAFFVGLMVIYLSVSLLLSLLTNLLNRTTQVKTR